MWLKKKYIWSIGTPLYILGWMWMILNQYRWDVVCVVSTDVEWLRICRGKLHLIGSCTLLRLMAKPHAVHAVPLKGQISGFIGPWVISTVLKEQRKCMEESGLSVLFEFVRRSGGGGHQSIFWIMDWQWMILFFLHSIALNLWIAHHPLGLRERFVWNWNQQTDLDCNALPLRVCKKPAWL